MTCVSDILHTMLGLARASIILFEIESIAGRTCRGSKHTWYADCQHRISYKQSVRTVQTLGEDMYSM